MLYDDLIQEAAQHGIDIYEEPLKTTIKGLYADNVIWINRHIPTRVEKTCILAEEIGHYHTSVGDIIDQTDVRNRKQEHRARAWAYEKLVPLAKIVQAYHAHVSDRHELAEYLDVTEEFLQAAIDRYREKYGTFTIVDKHIIYFDPLGVVETFE
jgi:Zn-dependent peptidase ImmA (M78 family)